MKEKFITTIIPFIKKYGIFITPVVLFLLFMFLLVFSYTKQPSKTKIPSNPSPSPSSISNYYGGPSEIPSLSTGQGGDINNVGPDEKTELKWTPIAFSPNDLGNTTVDTKTLPDGTTQYTYASDTPSRPIVTIVNTNGINIFQRMPIYNTSVNGFTDFYGNPDYTAKGSQYWGAKAITYIYLTRGFAFVFNPDINQVYEEMFFQPVTKDQFKQTYDNDLIGDLQPYHP